MIVLLAAVVVVCVGVVVVAVGRGGQMAEFMHDTPPLGLPVRRPIAGTDVALLRLPAGPWGYSFRVTDDALRRIAHAITERDTRIAVLEQQVSELRAARSAPPPKPSAEEDSGSPWFDRSAPFEARLPRSPEPAALESKPADAEPEDTALEDTQPAKPEPPDPEAAKSEAAEPEAAKAGAAEPKVAEPEDAKTGVVKSEDAKAEEAEPEAAESQGAKAAEAESEEAKPSAAEPDEDWVFEDDVEPVVEPLAGFTATVPSPGDRLVASTRTQADDDAEPEDTPEDTPEDKADDTADREPRGEGH